MSTVTIAQDQYWVHNRYGTRCRIWDVIDGVVEMNSPSGNEVTVTVDELLAGYTLEVAK